MTDVSPDLTTPTPTPSETTQGDNNMEVTVAHGQQESSTESEVSQTSNNPFVSTEEVSKGEEESTDTDYSINCPEYVSQEEVKAHIEAFKEAGIDSKTAQKVVDRLVAHGETNKNRSIERLDKALSEDKTALKSEYGADYPGRERAIKRYLQDTNIADDDVSSLVSLWGFQKTFKFFDRYAQMNKESSAGDTFAKSESGTSSIASDDIFSTPEFTEKRRAGDAEANKKIRQWALQQATLNQ
ncbi:hypothetical protein AYJ09_01455 [Candidatus Liberibacter solanacearum]|nr:hypothetical protein AYJ09_01455 [Candidatus Liberibacter solanacearum]